MSWAPWASLVTQLWANADWLEQQWSVGPIPADGVGKEIIIRTSTDLHTGVCFGNRCHVVMPDCLPAAVICCAAGCVLCCCKWHCPVRLWASANWLDQDLTDGPIPADGVAKEIIVRTSTDQQTGAFFCLGRLVYRCTGLV